MAAVSKKYRNSGMELSTPLFHFLQLLYRIHLNLIELHSKHKHIDIFSLLFYIIIITMSSKNCVSAITWGVFCMNESTIYPHCLVASCYKPASQRKVAPDWRCPVKVIALVLFAALEDLAQQRIGALGGWNAQSLVRRMHIMQLRPEWDNVKVGDLCCNQAAFEAAMGCADRSFTATDALR